MQHTFDYTFDVIGLARPACDGPREASHERLSVC